jgi:hypothetical protein
MATMTETPTMITPSHEFHAEAHALSGELQRPIEQRIEKHVPVTLTGRRATHLTRAIEDVSIEGLISLQRGHSRVSGSKSLKHHGWVTLSTSILDGLNVFEIISADRLVSQVSTDHPLENGHFPHVTFLGTQFDNFRVSGFPVELTLNFGICGDRDHGDISYLDNPTFLAAVREQIEAIAGAEGLPAELRKEYDGRLKRVNDLIDSCGRRKEGECKPAIRCSLVTKIGKVPIPGVRSFGHVLVIPEFGVVSLGEIEVGEKMPDPLPTDVEPRPDNYFELKSIRMNLGCVGHGTVDAGTVAANGHHSP